MTLVQLKVVLTASVSFLQLLVAILQISVVKEKVALVDANGGLLCAVFICLNGQFVRLRCLQHKVVNTATKSSCSCWL